MWWTGRPGMLRFMGSQRVRHDWATELNWSCVQIFATPWTVDSPSFTNSWGLLRFMSIESMMLSNQLILYSSLFLLPLIFPSIRVFANESTLCIRWPKYWSFSFSFSISPSNECSGLFPLGLAGLISLLSKGHLRVFSSTTVRKHHSAVLRLLYGPTLLYMTTGKTTA